MISKKIWIPIYSYRIWYIEVEDFNDITKLVQFAKRMHLGEDNINEIKDRMQANPIAVVKLSEINFRNSFFVNLINTSSII